MMGDATATTTMTVMGQRLPKSGAVVRAHVALSPLWQQKCTEQWRKAHKKFVRTLTASS
jgi:hypothetical protein